jgi:hypothetical protein
MAVMMFDKVNYSFVVGQEFNVTLIVQNVSNLAMWWLKLSFDSNIIEYKRFSLPVDNVFAGNSLVIADTWVENSTLFAAVALGEPNDTEFSGSGKLITFVFDGKSTGVTSMNFTDIGEWTIMTHISGSYPDIDIPFEVVNSTAHSVTCFGDVNSDGIVDMRDVSQAVIAFNSFVGTARWDMYADVDGNGHVDMRDIVMVVLKFGTGA